MCLSQMTAQEQRVSKPHKFAGCFMMFTGLLHLIAAVVEGWDPRFILADYNMSGIDGFIHSILGVPFLNPRVYLQLFHPTVVMLYFLLQTIFLILSMYHWSLPLTTPIGAVVAVGWFRLILFFVCFLSSVYIIWLERSWCPCLKKGDLQQSADTEQVEINEMRTV